jgi:hypothetical protein
VGDFEQLSVPSEPENEVCDTTEERPGLTDYQCSEERLLLAKNIV